MSHRFSTATDVTETSMSTPPATHRGVTAPRWWSTAASGRPRTRSASPAAHLSESVNRLVKRAAQRGYAPTHGQSHPAPPGQSIRGVSTLYNAAGEVQAQWVKTKASAEDLHEQLRVFVEELRETAPRAEPARPPLDTADDTLAVYPIGDPHMGMFAWREEGGEDFDLKIATRDMRRAVDVLMDATPASNTAVVLPLGDFLHGDNSNNATPKSGNSLDVDTRYAKVLRAGARLMLDVVHTALRRHHQVIVRMVQGQPRPRVVSGSSADS